MCCRSVAYNNIVEYSILIFYQKIARKCCMHQFKLSDLLSNAYYQKNKREILLVTALINAIQ